MAINCRLNLAQFITFKVFGYLELIVYFNFTLELEKILFNKKILLRIKNNILYENFRSFYFI